MGKLTTDLQFPIRQRGHGLGQLQSCGTRRERSTSTLVTKTTMVRMESSRVRVRMKRS